MTADAGHLLLIGAGGLVGRHLRQSATRAGYHVMSLAVPWQDPQASKEALRLGIENFWRQLPAGLPWSLVWAAGAGVVATSDDDLAAEQEVFAHAFTSFTVGSQVGGALGVPPGGAVVLISSAGGVYAGSASPPFTEDTKPEPLVAYGRVKLAMETVAAQHTQPHGIPLFIARLSNVYGPGQRLTKPQGLISQICLSHVTGSPLPVYVSHDTLRDYVYAPDVADLIVAALTRLQAQRPSRPVVKIVADGAPITVGHLLGEARRVLRRPLRTVTVAGRGGGQVADLRFRSVVWTDLDAALRTTLPAGLAATAADVAERVASGGDLDLPE